MESDDHAPLINYTETNNSSRNDFNNRVNNIETEESWLSGIIAKVLRNTANCLAHTLIGANACVALWYALKSTPITAFQLHVALSVIGYQLLLAHGILCLRSGTGWSSLSLKHRRRVHWALQLTGSITAIAGSAIMIREKTIHFNTTHGKLALSALIFTSASLINGMTSLYAVELRHFIPARVSKISHVVFGNAAFFLSSACLAFGYCKNNFKSWASEEFSYVMIGIVIINSVIVVLKPIAFKTTIHFLWAWKVKIC